MRLSFARTIARDYSVDAEIEQAQEKYSRIEDVWMGVQWDLARSPETGVALDGFWLKKSPVWALEGVPIITALYTFDDNEVQVEAIRISDAKED